MTFLFYFQPFLLDGYFITRMKGALELISQKIKERIDLVSQINMHIKQVDEKI